jgi:hypothetical protein
MYPYLPRYLVLHYESDLNIMVSSLNVKEIIKMNENLKKELKDKKKLQEILGVNRVQAWRIWEGHSKLTTANERLIKLTLGI